MLAHVSTFWLPKRGSSIQEYEDAFWVGPNGDSEGEIRQKFLRVAIADGASESMLASRWANRLVAAFGTTRNAARTKRGFIAAYGEAVSGWDDEVLKYTTDRELRGSPIQWYEEPGLAKGAYATVLAAEFSDPRQDRPPEWAASSLGDSCLFQVRDESLYASFPMSDATAFSYQPALLASRGADDDALRRNISLKSTDWERGDSFYLATDALAAWFLRAIEADGRPWETLRDLDTLAAQLDFSDWVDEQRDLGRINNDDTTLVRIDMC